MTTKTTKTTKKGAKTQSDEERVAAGLAFKDREGTFSEFLLLYEEPGATGMKPCGHSLMDAHGNEFPCMRKQGKKCVRVTDISVPGEARHSPSTGSCGQTRL